MLFPLHLSRSCVRGLFLGLLASGLTNLSLQAQTYYYYPTSNAAPSAVSPPQYYYYYPTTYSYPPQTTASAPQYYQTAYTQQVAQTPALAQEVQAPPVPAAPSAEPTPAPPASQPPTPTATVYAGDPYGFTTWLNATRAAYGLAPVGYDPNLAGWAAANNDQQAARGMGHFVMGPASRQNSAMGTFPGVEAMWMASPAHRAALLDPTIRWIGIAGLGAWWTFNAN